jgi:hypothetical protein
MTSTNNVETINELLTVLVITIVGLCIGFAIFLYKHGKEHKKEIREAGSNKGKSGQHDKSMHDESSGASTTSGTSTETTKR